jgi:hypothetical protein
VVGNVKLIIGAVVATVVGLMGFALWLQQNKIDTLNENLGKVETALAVEQANNKFLLETQKRNQEFADELARVRQGNERAIEDLGNQLDMERAKNYSLALKVPFDAGNNITRFLSWWMCEVEATSSDGAGSCDIHAPVSENAAVNFAQVHTTETARDLEAACEAGLEDSCNYVLVAFTWDGWHNLQGYLSRLLVTLQGYASNEEYFRKALEQASSQ